jgi:hypothetical protein
MRCLCSNEELLERWEYYAQNPEMFNHLAPVKVDHFAPRIAEWCKGIRQGNLDWMRDLRDFTEWLLSLPPAGPPAQSQYGIGIDHIVADSEAIPDANLRSRNGNRTYRRAA